MAQQDLLISKQPSDPSDRKAVRALPHEQSHNRQGLPDASLHPDLLAQLQKSDLISAFAAGLAHEVNSPLSGIFQGMQNLMRRLDPELEQNLRVAEECGCDLEATGVYLRRRGILATVETVRHSAERAATLVSAMLGFSRRKHEARVALNVKELVECSVLLAGLDPLIKTALLEEGLIITQEYDHYLPLLYGHTTEIEQVLLNLMKNAVQAMQEGRKTRETPATSSTPLGPTPLGPTSSRPMTLRLSAYSHNKRLHITVEDSGPGIPATLLPSIFDPFVTSKSDGTGLGLFIARHIVEEHGGTIDITSEPGVGATFTLSWPVST